MAAVYRVKSGRKAFVNSTLLSGGQEFTVEVAYKETPEWAEKVEAGAPAYRKNVKPSEPKKFEDVDLATTPTVQL